ncbi:MAG TPA: HWE histidine kinase domain-containing protein [Phenylobacterium sp.]|uniref:sensor histidine kinase n=1 Tax=Phenylobacterium sp. TaxID=1871053 RepID=UPI002D2F8D6E|nr:HWE histidine kinase domain-containing protein [Phenylobacterium sp.]HZZ67170.1 HWE histidine kinase domain-containing protein [Phenylobacterium sp.]
MSPDSTEQVAARMGEASKPRPDLEQLFRAMPGQYMILDRDLVYVEANPAYCASTERTREEIVGRNVFEAFPPTGEGARQIEASLRRVLVTGVAETLPLAAYPIPAPEGGFRMKYWSCVHLPLFDENGEVAFVAQNAVDVTELQQLKTIAYGPDPGAPAHGESDLFQRAQEVTALNEALAAETRGLRDLFMQTPGFMAVLMGPELTYAQANNAYLQLIGHRPVVGRPLAEALPEVVEQGFPDLLHRVMRDKTPFIDHAASVLLQRTPGGALEERFLDFIFQPIAGQDGEAVGVFVEGSDVTDRVLGERQQKLLVDELNHRVKNTLSTVQAIADQTLRTNADPEAFRNAFEARLMALSATHDLLTATNWMSADLREVAQLEFRPYGPERYRLEGPTVALTPAKALALGLLFHELATNAAKYGALAHGDGRVEVDWRRRQREGRTSLEIDWREQDGPPVAPPTRRGFGSRLIERSLQGQLGGEATLTYAPDGVRCHIRLPLTQD